MKQQILREIVRADEKHFLHIELPEGFADEVEVLILPLKRMGKQEQTVDNIISSESMDVMRLTDETGFVREVINSTEEDCWNDL